MKLARLKRIAKPVILICFTVFVVLPVFFACIFVIQDWRYARFRWRGDTYYAHVAEACDQLVAQAEPAEREIRRDKLQLLPDVLRELNPDYVKMSSKIVLVRVGSGLIIWAPEESNRAWWDLTSYGGDSRHGRRLFSKMKPEAAKPASAVAGGIPLPFNIERPRPAATESPR
jgi:hypothetical protein